MNKILIIYIGFVNERHYDCQVAFYEALAEYLISLGHDVLLWNCWSYVSLHNDTLSFSSESVEQSILSQILHFNPNIILDFNNVLPTSLKEQLNVHHIVFCADNAEFICHHSRLLTGDTHYISCSQSISQQIQRMFNAEEKHIFIIECATGIQAQERTQDKNITFLGTNFGASIYDFSQRVSANYALHRAEPYIEPVIRAIQDNYYIELDELYTLLSHTHKQPHREMLAYLLPMLKHALVKEHRIAHLSMLSDIGLHLYGPQASRADWNELLLYNLELALCYHRKSIYSLKDNEALYNSSIIGLNISHLQAVGGFSWRVADIMASNACIMTEREDVFIKLFQDYFTEEQLEVILYRDKYDMREKAIELLNNKPLRDSIVQQSHLAIEERYRWHHFTPILENAFKKELAIGRGEYGDIYCIQHPSTMSTPPPSCLHTPRKLRKTKTQRYSYHSQEHR